MQASSASSSIQDPSEATVLPDVEPIAFGQTETEADDSTALEALTDFPDVPFERIDLPSVSEIPPEGPDTVKVELVDIPIVDDEEAPDPNKPPPEWCVDMGDTITAMSTFELWMALARGDVDANTRVWGMGMDNWEIVADIPELAYAISNEWSLVPPPVMPTPTAIMNVRGNDRTPLGFGTTDAANDDFPAQSGPISRRWKGFSFGRVALAVGGLAAAAAVGLSSVPRSMETTGQAAGEHRPTAVARLQGAMERANRQVDAGTQRWLEAEAARAVEPVTPKSSARQHKDVGQRRVRRGHH